MIYVVGKGENVEGISRCTGISADRILRDNQIMDTYALVPGQALVLRTSESVRGSMDVKTGGYVYPPMVLQNTVFPFDRLVELFVCSYGFTFGGTLIPPLWGDGWILQTAHGQNADVMMVVRPFSEGIFTDQIVKTLVGNRSVQERLIAEILDVSGKRGYAGVEISLECISVEDRTAFENFAKRFHSSLNREGLRFSVSVPACMGERERLAEEDYARMKEYADTVFLETYGWGSAYGPPTAVAPLDKVRRMVESALRTIPADRLVMGISNYGYDWQIPCKQGGAKANIVGVTQAVEIASENGAVIEYAQQSKSPWFRYRKKGKGHMVWFEDVRSLGEKWNLVGEYGLSGVRYRDALRAFPLEWMNEFMKS